VRRQHLAGERRRSSGVFAAGIDSDTPHIALPASVEAQIETASRPYTAAAFFHFKATGSLKRHRAYHAAYNSDTFSVEFEADYESGELTISVEGRRTASRSSRTSSQHRQYYFLSAGDGCRRIT